MKRYVNSFFITLFIYLILAGTFFVILANNIVIQKEVKKNKTISLKHIKLIEKIEPKPQKVEEVQIPQVIKKHKEVTVLKKKIEKKVIKKKRIIKKKKIVKKRIKKKILKRTVVKKHIEKKQEIVEQKIVKEIIKTKLVEKVFTKTQVIKKAIPYKEDFLRKNLYLIQKAIQKSIIYPKRAKRMNVQGRIIVEFTLLTDGRLQDIKVISGHRLLRKATIKALEKALSFFPIVSQRITIKAPIDYRLR